MSKWFWNDSMTEAELRTIANEMRDELSTLDYNSDEHTKLHSEYGDIVSLINRKYMEGPTRREHGWYLSNDD